MQKDVGHMECFIQSNGLPRLETLRNVTRLRIEQVPSCFSQLNQDTCVDCVADGPKKALVCDTDGTWLGTTANKQPGQIDTIISDQKNILV